MTFLGEPELWPRDISMKNTFLVKAVQEIGRSLSKTETRLPLGVYKYDIVLSDFRHASEDQKEIAADVIHHNTATDHVRCSEKSFYSEASESSVVIINHRITEQQWDLATDLIQRSKEILVENIDNAIAITAALLEGVASGMIAAVQRAVDGPDFKALNAEKLNIDRDAVVLARLALGQIDQDKPFDLNPRGNCYIFLESRSFNQWKKSIGRRCVLIEIAKRKLLRLAEKYPNGFPSSFSKETLMQQEHTGFLLEEKDRETLWERLPDKPFKLPGLRQGASRKGRP